MLNIFSILFEKHHFDVNCSYWSPVSFDLQSLLGLHSLSSFPASCVFFSQLVFGRRSCLRVDMLTYLVRALVAFHPQTSLVVDCVYHSYSSHGRTLWCTWSVVLPASLDDRYCRDKFWRKILWRRLPHIVQVSTQSRHLHTALERTSLNEWIIIKCTLRTTVANVSRNKR